MLAPTNREIKIYPPSKLEKPLTTDEISQAASKLKNGTVYPKTSLQNNQHINQEEGQLNLYHGL